jgi:hypothetical protein
MKYHKNNPGVSEILGAVLLVSLLITGLSIISIVMLSGPPPTTTMKAIIGVKCSWCPNLNPPQYDILIGHEGGEAIHLKSLILTLFLGNRSEVIIPVGNITIFSPGDTGITIPPDTCDGRTGEVWSPDETFSTGKSLKYSFKGMPDDNPIALLIQEPSSFGYSTISQMKINYIQNITNTSTETGYAGLKHVDNILFSLVPYIGNVSPWTPSGCDVEFTYTNNNQTSLNFTFGNTQQSMWNYIESVPGWYSTWTVEYKRDFFPGYSSGTAVKIKNFKGKIIYNLGSLSTNQVTCLEY